MFQKHLIEKYYLAISDTKPHKKQGLIVGDMKKSRNSAWKLTRTKENPAKTRFYSFSIANGKRLFLLRPFSGKTHQLRVAMKSIGSPILGDSLYKGSNSDRAYLHAYAVKFSLFGQDYQFTNLPETGIHFSELNALLDATPDLKKPWSLKW